MNGIGKVDQIVLQLRAQLQRAAKTRGQLSARASSSEKGPLDRFRALEQAQGYADRDLRRKFVRALLTEELGEDLANQPEFERISDEVWALMEKDERLRPRLEEALQELGLG